LGAGAGWCGVLSDSLDSGNISVFLQSGSAAGISEAGLGAASNLGTVDMRQADMGAASKSVAEEGMTTRSSTSSNECLDEEPKFFLFLLISQHVAQRQQEKQRRSKSFACLENE
jgi:hypothetical protein